MLGYLVCLVNSRRIGLAGNNWKRCLLVSVLATLSIDIQGGVLVRKRPDRNQSSDQSGTTRPSGRGRLSPSCNIHYSKMASMVQSRFQITK